MSDNTSPRVAEVFGSRLEKITENDLIPPTSKRPEQSKIFGEANLYLRKVYSLRVRLMIEMKTKEEEMDDLREAQKGFLDKVTRRKIKDRLVYLGESLSLAGALLDYGDFLFYLQSCLDLPPLPKGHEVEICSDWSFVLIPAQTGREREPGAGFQKPENSTATMLPPTLGSTARH